MRFLGLLIMAISLVPGMAVTFARQPPASDLAEKPAGEAVELLQKALEERGGAAAMSGLLEIRREGELLTAQRDGEHLTPLVMMVRPPDTLFIETGSGEERYRQELEAGKGWETRGVEPRSPLGVDAAAMLRSLILVDEAFVLSAALAGTVEVVGVEEAGPGQVDVSLPAAYGRAVLLRGTGGREYRMVFPEGGGLPLRVDYQVTREDGTVEELSDVFARWTRTDGLLFPGEVVLFKAGRPVSAARFPTITLKMKP